MKAPFQCSILTFALAFLATAASTGAANASGPDTLSSAAAAEVARTFRHPLLHEVDIRASIDTAGWYVVDDFGDPLGKPCRLPGSKICYSLGENWIHVNGAMGRPVRAVANGEILEFGYSRKSGGKLPNSLGNYILIKHTLPSPGRRIPGVGWTTTVISLYAYLKDLWPAPGFVDTRLS